MNMNLHICTYVLLATNTERYKKLFGLQTLLFKYIFIVIKAYVYEKQLGKLNYIKKAYLKKSI